MRIKKVLSFLTALTLTVSVFSGCGKKNDSEAPAPAAETTASETVPAETEAPSFIADIVGGAAVVPDITVEKYDVPDNDAMKFVKDMKIGWNLGNTLDAVADVTPEDDLSIESAWVGVKASKELIDNIKAAGFNTVRVPVSWHNHVDAEYNINAPFLDRVQEVVNYVIDNGMYCIIDIHHDNEKGFFYPDPENLEGSKKYVGKIWEQLAERFKDYDNKLIFEGLNEPRLKDTNLEWVVKKNDQKSLDSVDCINQLEQVFVDTVRASGGKNSERYLMVPGYAASIDGVMLDEFKLPNDTADNKIIVDVHAYTPYDFALQDTSGTCDWSLDNNSSTHPIDWFMDQAYDKFVSKGIPVVIGEFGARNKKENLQARVDFSAYYVASARARGMTCCWWDNNSFYGTGENFGLFDRKAKTWKFPDIILSLMKYAE